jgi:hypothetical protein
MFEFRVELTPRTTEVSTGINYTKEFLNESYTQLYDFFKDCIDRNLVINAVDLDADSSVDWTNYYSTTLENAQAFQQVFEDMNADFSLKKFWDRCGFDMSTSITEIDFDNVDHVFSLIDEDTGEIWSVAFPLD